MKKIISLVLVLAMMAVIATGCGGSSDKGDSNAQAPAQAAETTEASDNTASDNAENKGDAATVNNDGYIIMVTDSEGAPVVGAAVQFCSDTQCMMGKTDDTGCAVFKVDPGKYTVHIHKAEGYVVPEEEFAVPEQYGVVQITLEKK